MTGRLVTTSVSTTVAELSSSMSVVDPSSIVAESLSSILSVVTPKDVTSAVVWSIDVDIDVKSLVDSTVG